MAASFDLDFFLVERHWGIGGLALDFKDKTGTVVANAKGAIIKSRYELKDAAGNHIGEVKHGGLLSPVYNIMDASNSIVGAVNLGTGWTSLLSGIRAITVASSDGTVLGNAQGDFMNYEYTIMSPDNSKVLARISRTMPQGIKGFLLSGIKMQYGMQVFDKQIPTIVLMGFAVLVEHLAQQAQANRNRMGTSGGMMGPGFGFGRGGIKIG